MNKQQTAEILDLIYYNSSKTYKKNGTTYVDNLDVRKFVVELVIELNTNHN
jgi:hypothetical protein